MGPPLPSEQRSQGLTAYDSYSLILGYNDSLLILDQRFQSLGTIARGVTWALRTPACPPSRISTR